MFWKRDKYKLFKKINLYIYSLSGEFKKKCFPFAYKTAVRFRIKSSILHSIWSPRVIQIRLDVTRTCFLFKVFAILLEMAIIRFFITLKQVRFQIELYRWHTSGIEAEQLVALWKLVNGFVINRFLELFKRKMTWTLRQPHVYLC